MRASNTSAFIDFDPHPFKGFENVLFGSWNIPALIRIFNPEDHCALALPGQ
jgi:hypothetical protein